MCYVVEGSLLQKRAASKAQGQPLRLADTINKKLPKRAGNSNHIALALIILVYCALPVFPISRITQLSPRKRSHTVRMLSSELSSFLRYYRYAEKWFLSDPRSLTSPKPPIPGRSTGTRTPWEVNATSRKGAMLFKDFRNSPEVSLFFPLNVRALPICSV